MIKIGDKAPINIEVLDQNGEKTSLTKLLGKTVVVYIYPRDNTPGCTTEACDFRDYNQELKNLGVQIIGISGDSPSSHLKFSNKHELSFPLWSDQEKKLISAFGAINQKSMFGKIYQGINRMTFILNKEGIIIKIWPKVNVKNHVQEVLKFVKNLK